MSPASLDARKGSSPPPAPTAVSHEEQPALVTLVAHELREPLGLLHGYLSMLEAGELPPEHVGSAVAVMQTKVAEMNHLVDSLLTMTRLDAHGLVPASTRFAVDDAIEEAIRALSARAELAMGTIEKDGPDGPVHVRADRDHVLRILVNLLANAVSYSPGPPRITIGVEAEDPVEVRVLDNGVGVPDDQRERIFQRFTRIEDQAHPSPGFGLGLPLSRELAEANGGTLELEESRPGSGSVFLLRLPAADDSARC